MGICILLLTIGVEHTIFHHIKEIISVGGGCMNTGNCEGYPVTYNGAPHSYMYKAKAKFTEWRTIASKL